MSSTIRDVAEKANVSVATVSRVLNESDSVRDETKAQVLDAVDALNYLPNESARNLRTQTTRTVGVLLPNMHGEFFAQVTRGLDQRAGEDGHHVLVSNSHTDEAEAESVLRSLLGRVDGLIILWPRLDIAFLESLVPEDLPIVLLSTSVDTPRFHTLSFDNRGGAYAAVEHLAEHGHERVAMLTGGPDNFDAQERLAGYRDAVADLGLAADPDLVVEGDFTQEAGRSAVDRLTRLTPPPTALFASNDSMALGVLRGVHEADLRVPDDLALVGFDDIPTAQYVAPSLTTVRAPTLELGRRAVDALLEASSAPRPPAHQTLATRLIRRESCGCPPTEHAPSHSSSAPG